jgi:TonB family protein
LAGWQEFSIEQAGFKIRFPQKPKLTLKEVKIGKFESAAFLTEIKGESYFSVLYFGAPHLEDEETTNLLLNGMRNFVVGEVKGKLLKERAGLFGEHPARIIEVDVAKGEPARALIIVAGARIYRILAGPGEKPNAPGVSEAVTAKFFASFRLTTIVRDLEGEVERYLHEHPEIVQREMASPNEPFGPVLNGKAISLPKPAFPSIARAARASGIVTVRVIIDEEGKIIAAQAVSGHPLLRPSAVAAARQARFTPTLVNGKAVPVMGVINYNFSP